VTELPADWFLLLLRVLFVFLLYFFLYQLFRVQVRQLMSVSSAVAERRGEQPAPAATLVVIPGATTVPAIGTRFELRPTTSVGRRDDNSIHVNEPSISANHAEIRLSTRGWLVTDLDSTNGTFVNGERIRGTTSINSGDVVQFGRVRMQLNQ
jgi:pSer/pThr/pTyr-binding forkhead associated (FHA) protein